MAVGRKTGGRKKGVPNKATADVRSAIAALAIAKAPLIDGLFDQVAAEDPGRAIDLYTRLIEYHIPKLGRTEVTGKDGGPVTVIEITREGPNE